MRRGGLRICASPRWPRVDLAIAANFSEEGYQRGDCDSAYADARRHGRAGAHHRLRRLVGRRAGADRRAGRRVVCRAGAGGPAQLRRRREPRGAAGRGEAGGARQGERFWRQHHGPGRNLLAAGQQESAATPGNSMGNSMNSFFAYAGVRAPRLCPPDAGDAARTGWKVAYTWAARVQACFSSATPDVNWHGEPPFGDSLRAARVGKARLPTVLRPRADPVEQYGSSVAEGFFFWCR